MSGLRGVDELQLQLEDAVDAALRAQSPVWSRSTIPWPAFPGSEKVASRSFAVGVASSTTIGARQAPAEGALALTVLSVRWALQLRADARVADYRAALASERLVIAAALSAGLPLRLAGLPTRTTTPDGAVYVGDVRFEIRHRMPLTG